MALKSPETCPGCKAVRNVWKCPVNEVVHKTWGPPFERTRVTACFCDRGNQEVFLEGMTGLRKQKFRPSEVSQIAREW